MVPLGAVRLAPQRQVFLGQEAPPAPVMVVVTLDGVPLPGTFVEIMYMDGSSADGMTDAAGKVQKTYGQAQLGQAMVRITPEAMDLGEDNVKTVDLTGSPATVTFDLSSGAAPAEPAPAAPALPTRNIIAAAVTTVAMVAIGMNV